MTRERLSRRQWLKGTAAAAGATAAAAQTATATAADPRPKKPFLFMLNTSTIRGQKVGVVKEVEIAQKAGYDAIEPWVRELDEYVKDGGSLKDLGKRIADAGLRVESAIGFMDWVVDDDDKRKKGLEEARRSMDIVQQIGGKRLAAPPSGATNTTGLNLMKAAERYRDLLDLGLKMGVVPQVEVWGFSKSLSRLGETMLVALECGRREACVLPDVYHLYKGGSDFAGVKLLGGVSMHVFHMNDYPDMPGRAAITDAHRVYPGDGVAPLKQMVKDLYAIGFRGAMSLELFNPEYWKQDALAVAKTGLEKMQSLVQASLEG